MSYFGIYVLLTVICVACQCKSDTFDPFLDISLDIKVRTNKVFIAFIVVTIIENKEECFTINFFLE